MSRRQLPKPTRRKNSKTYEIRTRINGKIVSKSLKTPDYNEAMQRLPSYFDELVKEQQAKDAPPPVACVQPSATRKVRTKAVVRYEPCEDPPDMSVLIAPLGAYSFASQPQARATTNTSAPTPTLSEVLEEYLRERGNDLRKAIIDEHRTTVRDFCDVVGNKPVNAYTREDGRRFKEVLLALPANRLKLPQTRNLGAVQAAEVATKLGLPRQATKTVQNKRGTLRKIFDYASANYDGVFNPFANKAAWALSYKPGPNQRDSFSDAELKALFGAPLPGYLYWLSWLGLCTGARLNELCQLTVDLVRREPVPHLYFGPSMRLKTGDLGSSIRAVPLHSKVLALGFLDYASGSSDNDGGQLFPGLPERRGLLSHKPSRHFADHLTALGIKRPKLSFHSLRHNFAAEFKRRAPSESETRERLMGHAVAGVAGRYGGSYEVEANDADLLIERAKSIAKLKFDF